MCLLLDSLFDFKAGSNSQANPAYESNMNERHSQDARRAAEQAFMESLANLHDRLQEEEETEEASPEADAKSKSRRRSNDSSPPKPPARKQPVNEQQRWEDAVNDIDNYLQSRDPNSKDSRLL